MGIALTVLDGQNNFRVLGHHSEQGGYPHPENSAGAAHGDSAGNAGYVAGADGGGKGCSNRLEGRHLAVARLLLMEHLPYGVLHGIAKFSELDEANAKAQDNTRAHQKDKHPRPPGNTVQKVYDLTKPFHIFSSIFSSSKEAS